MRNRMLVQSALVALWLANSALAANPDEYASESQEVRPATLGQFEFPQAALSLTLADVSQPSDTDSAEAPADSEPTPDEAAIDPGDDAQKMSVSDLATKLSNPVGDLWVITNQYNITQFSGGSFHGGRWQNNLNIQPVLPLHLTDKWNLINRPIIPLYFYSPYPNLSFNPRATLPRLLTGSIIRGTSRVDHAVVDGALHGARRLGRVFFGGPSNSVPGLGIGGPLHAARRLHRVLSRGTTNNVFGRGIGGFSSRRAVHTASALSAGLDVDTDRACGIGDITLMSLLSPRQPPKVGNGSLVWGFGPTLIFPTASPDVLGQGQFQAGPAAVALYMDKKWVAGALVQQWWSFAEKGGGHPYTNQMSFQYFAWYQFHPGWQVGTSPIATVNWTESCNEGFTFPIGLGIQHTTHIGKLPIKVGVQYMYSVVHPDSDIGSRSQIQITVSPVLPALIKGNIFD